MHKTYSYDLRIRVMNSIERGKTIQEVSKIFSISPRTISNWKSLKLKTGDLKSQVRYQKGHSHKITDKQAFIKFVERNTNCTIKEMAESCGNLGSTTIARVLNKINFTNKKKYRIHRKG